MNGAGKTTIFRALVGETVANIEKAVIYGVDSALDDDQFYGMVGYCPQKGGLIDFLTGRQSLYFFAALRGVPWKNIREEVDKWLDVFGNYVTKSNKLAPVTNKFVFTQRYVGI